MAVTAASIYKGNDGRMWYDLAADTTLDATYSGLVLNVTATGKTLTLPATAVGLVFTVRNGGVADTDAATGSAYDGSVTVNVSPNAADKISGNGFTATDDKDAINTLGDIGDEITLVADGSLGWYVVNVKGTWARE